MTTSPDTAAAVLEIKLAQNSLSFFFPASTISGHVIYRNHYGNADYDLSIIFAGHNKIRQWSGQDYGPPEKATLFEYTHNLHAARKGGSHRMSTKVIDLAPRELHFKHRFPSSTDNRSFSVPGGSMLDLTFNNHVHDLPPSFEDHASEFICSVDYELRAELRIDDCLVASYTLPVVFLPYTRPIHGVRSSPNFLAIPDPYTDKFLSKIRKDSLVGHYPDTVLNMSVELPNEITLGSPFTFDICIQVPHAPEYDEDFHEVKVLMLKITAKTSARILEQRPPSFSVDQQDFRKEHSITLHPTEDDSLSPTYDQFTKRLLYRFQATLSSYFSPSFRSFLISSSFSFDGPIPIVVDGRTLEIPLANNEVTVLSSVPQPVSSRKISAMIANTRVGVQNTLPVYSRA